MFLFGLTWLFAILTFSVTGLRETFQILFTLLNSFQGFFILLFFCAINKEARESWKEIFGSGRQSKLLHSPYINSNGHTPNRNHVTTFRAQRSGTDTSTLRHHDHKFMISELGGSRKESWDSENSGYQPDTLQERTNILATEEPDTLLKIIMAEKDKVKPNDETVDPIQVKQLPKVLDDLVDNISLTSAMTESGIDPADCASIGEDDPISKDDSPPSSGAATESAAVDHTTSIGANLERKESAVLKVCVKRYPSIIKREYDVEEMKVELHSESSSESNDEDDDLSN